MVSTRWKEEQRPPIVQTVEMLHNDHDELKDPPRLRLSSGPVTDRDRLPADTDLKHDFQPSEGFCRWHHRALRVPDRNDPWFAAFRSRSYLDFHNKNELKTD